MGIADWNSIRVYVSHRGEVRWMLQNDSQSLKKSLIHGHKEPSLRVSHIRIECLEIGVERTTRNALSTQGNCCSLQRKVVRCNAYHTHKSVFFHLLTTRDETNRNYCVKNEKKVSHLPRLNQRPMVIRPKIGSAP